MQLFRRNTDPVFLKEGSQAKIQLEELKKLRSSLDNEGQEQVDKEIRMIEYNIEGEENIAFELKNSHMLMYVLKDVHLEFEGLTAQIDYLVFTRKHCYIIECENLHGHIEITPEGDFLRLLFSNNGQERKEGIYSPITKNQQHLNLIRKIVVSQNKNSILKMAADKFFGNYYKSLIVLANPKTILHKKYAKKEIREQVVRADQLIAYIEKMDRLSSERSLSDKEIADRAHAFLKMHQVIKKDYTKRYAKNILKKSEIIDTSINQSKAESVPQSPVQNMEEHTKLHNVLATYRLLRSREEGSTPHSIYNDIELADLIRRMPKNKIDLLQVQGFNTFKIQKYGPDLLNIIAKYREHLKGS